MAVILSPPRADERGPARSLERRTPQEGEGASTSTSLATPESSPSPAPSVKGLSKPLIAPIASLLSILGVLLISFVIYRYVTRRRPKAKANAPRLVVAGNGLWDEGSQSNTHVVASPAAAMVRDSFPPSPTPWIYPGGAETQWVPQTLPTQSNDLEKGGVMSPQKSRFSLARFARKKYNSSDSAPLPTPPPVYSEKLSTSLAAQAKDLKIQTQGANVSPTSPVTSPRTTSISRIPSVKKSKRKSKYKQLKLPCLVTVCAAFTPSLPDELPILNGDTLRMLEEYEDEWCLVQRVGGHNPETGVIPRFCVQERKQIIPTSRTRWQAIPPKPSSSKRTPTNS